MICYWKNQKNHPIYTDVNADNMSITAMACSYGLYFFGSVTKNGYGSLGYWKNNEDFKALDTGTNFIFSRNSDAMQNVASFS